MSQRQRIGGIAALTAAGTFVFGFALFATMLADYATGDPTPAEAVAFLVDHQAALYVWNLVILIVFGVALIPLVLALHERYRAAAPAIVPMATVLGVIWAGVVIAAGMVANIGVGTVADLNDADPARAAVVWSALDSVQNGLGGGNEIVGGLWVALISAAALRTTAEPRSLHYLGILAGAAGIVTVIPALEAVGGIFGLGLIAWFIWIGLALLRESTPTSQETRERAVAVTR
jgi:hypothetical protein